MSGSLQVGTTYANHRMVIDLTDFIGTRIYFFGVWEPHLSAFIQQRLRPGDVFCDIGANIGYYTLLAGQTVGPNGLVIAIEPSPGCCELLRENIRLNALGNVRTVDAAVSDRVERLTLYRPVSGNMGKTTTVKSRGFVPVAEVPGLPLDQILKPQERRRLRLIKIDVEGAEWPILHNLLDTIDQYPADMEIVAELSTDETASEAPDATSIVERFRANGFRAFSVANAYEISAYLSFRGAEAPTLITGPITRQQDVLFSRQLGAPVV